MARSTDSSKQRTNRYGRRHVPSDHVVTDVERATQAERITTINVFVLHSQALVAQSLGLALDQTPDLNVVAVRTDDFLVPERVLNSGADVVLLEASPGAPRMTARLLASTPSLRVVILATERDRDLLAPCVASGAVAFLPEVHALEQIVWIIRRVVAGWVALTQDQLAVVFRDRQVRMVEPDLARRCAALTVRERAVLEVLATGATTVDAATRLRVSATTVQAHVRSCMRKLNAPSKLAAVVIALRGGAIHDPQE